MATLAAQVAYMKIDECEWAFTVYLQEASQKQALEDALRQKLQRCKCRSFSGRGEILMDPYAAYAIQPPVEDNVIAFLSDTGFDNVWKVLRSLLRKFFVSSTIRNQSNLACEKLKNPFLCGTDHHAMFSTYDDTCFNGEEFSLDFVYTVYKSTPAYDTPDPASENSKKRPHDTGTAQMRSAPARRAR